MTVIVPIEKVRAALARAEELGADTIEEACASAAAAIGIPVEMVEAVADAPDTDGSAAC